MAPYFENHAEGEESESGDEALLYVDVNLGPDNAERIVVYDGDTPESLAQEFAERHQLNEGMYEKLVAMLQTEINGMLEKISEEMSCDRD